MSRFQGGLGEFLSMRLPTLCLAILPLASCSRISLQHEQSAFEDGLGKQLSSCASKEVLRLIDASLTLNHLTMFKLVIRTCPIVVSQLLTEKDLRAVYAKLWSSEDRDAYLDFYLAEGRCNEGCLARQLVDSLGSSMTKRADIVISKNRLELLKKHCIVEPDMLRLILSKEGLSTKSRSYLASWIRLLEDQLPSWPHTDLTGGKEKGKIRMDTLAAYYSLRGDPYVLSSLPNGKHFSNGLQFQFNESAAAIVDSFNVAHLTDALTCNEEAFDAKVRNTKKLSKKPASFTYGRYKLDGSSLIVRAKFRIGVWVVRLQGTALTSICDTIWAKQKCPRLTVKVNQSTDERLVVIMGNRKVLHKQKQSHLKGLLQDSDVDSFDVAIGAWLNMYPIRKNRPRPVILASTITYTL